MSSLLIQLQNITKDIPIEPVSQGAEAVVYRTKIHPYLAEEVNSDVNPSYILKFRPPKPYRHPILDAQLTKHRTLSEARLLQKLGTSGVNVPNLVFVDARKGLIWMEDVAKYGSSTLKQWIWDTEKDIGDDNVSSNEKIRDIIIRVGLEIGKLHLIDIVHGDLTSSNIILRKEKKHLEDLEFSLSPVLIDFGLGSYSTLAEDKAVDLYVLERAVSSTHPVNSDHFTEWLLNGYRSCFKSKGDQKKLTEILRKLDAVRLRGRKRSMAG